MPDEKLATPQDGAETAAAAGKPPARKARATVLVDLDLCKACGICIALCPAKVFERDEAGQPVVARPEDCIVCRLCEWHCPDFAIEVLARRVGVKEAATKDARPGAPDPAPAKEGEA